MTELLKKLIKISAPSGREGKLATAIKEEIAPFCDEIYTDALGNLIAHKSGNGRKVMFTSGMDESGFFATYIEENGHIRISPVGNVNFYSAGYSHVVFENGANGVLVPDEGTAGDGISKADNYYVDIGTKSRAESEKKVELGEGIAVKGSMIKLYGDYYSGSPFDNRAGCAALIRTAQQLKESKNDMYFVFTAQSKVGGRCAPAASFGICADSIVAVGTTPFAKPSDGAVVVNCDGKTVCDRHLTEFIRNTAKEEKIKYTDCVAKTNCTEADMLRKSAYGAHTSVIAIPAKNVNTTAEIVKMSDINECVKLLLALCKKEFP